MKMSVKQKEHKSVLFWIIWTPPFHLKGIRKVERTPVHELLCSKKKAEKLSILGRSEKETSFCIFFWIDSKMKKAIIHAALINHSFTSCL